MSWENHTFVVGLEDFVNQFWSRCSKDWPTIARDIPVMRQTIADGFGCLERRCKETMMDPTRLLFESESRVDLSGNHELYIGRIVSQVVQSW